MRSAQKNANVSYVSRLNDLRYFLPTSNAYNIQYTTYTEVFRRSIPGIEPAEREVDDGR